MKGLLRRTDGWTGIALILTLVYVVIIVWPLGTVFAQSLTGGGGINLDGFATFFSSPLYYTTLLNSAAVTVSVTLLSLLIAFPMAYFMTMYRVRGGGAVQILLIASMMSPPFLGAYAWILLLGNNGLVTNAISVSYTHLTLPTIYSV